MAVIPSYKTTTEATEVEESYIDRGAVITPQTNSKSDAKYKMAEAQANAADYVEWPTKVHGQESQGF